MPYKIQYLAIYISTKWINFIIQIAKKRGQSVLKVAFKNPSINISSAQDWIQATRGFIWCNNLKTRSLSEVQNSQSRRTNYVSYTKSIRRVHGRNNSICSVLLYQWQREKILWEAYFILDYLVLLSCLFWLNEKIFYNSRLYTLFIEYLTLQMFSLLLPALCYLTKLSPIPWKLWIYPGNMENWDNKLPVINNRNIMVLDNKLTPESLHLLS